MLHITVRRFAYEAARAPHTACESGRQPESRGSILRLDVNVSRAIRLGLAAWFGSKIRHLAQGRERFLSTIECAQSPESGRRPACGRFFFGYALLEGNTPAG
jgi:hypothetical protein